MKMNGHSGRSAKDAPPRLDDLVREVGDRGVVARRAAMVAWGFGGFLIGAVFWQAIGFWDTLGEAILKRPEPKVSIVARLALPARLPKCTTLALDRLTGRTLSVPCVERMPVLEEAGLKGRSDLALAGVHLGDAARKTISALAAAGKQSPGHSK
jgi:hypothetical protein